MSSFVVVLEIILSLAYRMKAVHSYQSTVSIEDHSIKVPNLFQIRPSLARILNHTQALHNFITHLFTSNFNIITGTGLA
jgi:hypothetical protein